MDHCCTSARLPCDGGRRSFGILCHRNASDRVREALVTSCDKGWMRLEASGPIHEEASSIDAAGASCTVVPTPDEKGARKARQGYSLLVVEGAQASPADLPPMARRHISWAGKLTHQLILNGDAGCDTSEGNGAKECSSIQPLLQPLVQEVCKELVAQSFDCDRDFARIDVQPKEFAEEIRTAFRDGTYCKPMQLACSASKVSHVVNIIVVQSTQKIYWGISSNREHFQELNQRLNDHATSEIVLESTTHSKTGFDASPDASVAWDAPVSRAYYKLEEVFRDDKLSEAIARLRNNNQPTEEKSILLHGNGLDIGASPGGWTQVLRNSLGLPTVVAIDPGILAQRVSVLPGVCHIRSELSSEETIQGIAEHAPYSTIVCDASVSNANELLLKIVETFEKASSLLHQLDDSNNGNSPERNICSFPLCLVVTLKLPFKTAGSIERNLEKVNGNIPDCLRRFASLGSSSSPAEVRYKICHLFANSISERTLVAIFNEKS
ncbi:hypothetical protein ACHAXT_003192 [Thalassiosira profunda]